MHSNFVNLFIVFLPLPFPLLIDFGFGAGKHGTSSDASDEVCENTFRDTTEEAKLHEGSALLIRL